MKDAFGNPLTVGDKVVYPNRTGSNMYINRGVITHVDTKGKSITVLGEARTPTKWQPHIQPVKVRRMDRVTKLSVW